MGAHKTESLDRHKTIWPFPGSLPPGDYSGGTLPLKEGQILPPDRITPEDQPEAPIGNINNETPNERDSSRRGRF